MPAGTGVGPYTAAIAYAPRVAALEAGVAARAGTGDRALDRRGGVAVAQRVRVHRADDPPRLRRADLVADEVEHRDRAARLAHGVRAGDAVVAEEAQQEQADAGLGPQAVVSDRGRRGDRAAQHALGLGELAHVHERLAEVGQEAEPVGVERRHQVDRPAQEAGRGVHVAALERPLAGAGQPLARALAELAAVVVQRPELGQVAVRLLEVVGR